MFWEDETPESVSPSEDPKTPGVAAESKPNQKKSNTQLIDERELKIARLWSRVDELAEDHSRLKEKLRLLERGLTLGIIPDELKALDLKSSDRPSSPPALSVGQGTTAKSKGEAPATKSEGPTTEGPLSAQEEKAYQDAVVMAHEHFRSGRYGRAIVEYDSIGKKWGNRIPGAMYKYWVGKCWMELKEYSTARQIFNELITQFSSSPWVPRAKLEIGRSELRLGQNETAIRWFRDLIKDHPHADASELAQMELSNIGKNL